MTSNEGSLALNPDPELFGSTYSNQSGSQDLDTADPIRKVSRAFHKRPSSVGDTYRGLVSLTRIYLVLNYFGYTGGGGGETQIFIHY